MGVEIGPDGVIVGEPEIAWDGPVPTVAPLPSVAEMRDLEPEELREVAERLGLVDDRESRRALAAEYVARVSRMTAGDPAAFEREVARLADGFTRRSLLGIARGTMDRWVVAETLDLHGADTELVRIDEGDDDVCDECLERAGAVGTYAQHEALGRREVCLGHPMCRCTWAAIR